MLDESLRWLWGAAYTVHCLEVIENPLRSIVWATSNLLVAYAYFGIPHEIRLWSKAINLDMSGLVARLFRAFIVYCGVSHLAMVLVMPTTRWEIILFFFMPLAVVSLATYIVLRVSRQRILVNLTRARELLS